MELIPIGIIRSPYHKPGQAPRQGRLSSEVSRIEVRAEFLPGVGDLGRSSHIFVLYWLDKADRTMLFAVPPGTLEPRPVFCTRSPHRPNPIGLGIARVEEIAANVIKVTGLDAFDGTPVIDIKPYSRDIDCIPDAKNEIS